MKLVYLSPFPLSQDRATGEWILEGKSWTGVLEYARLWPGEVVFATPGVLPAAAGETPPGHLRQRIDGSSPVEILVVPPFAQREEQVASLRGLAPDVVLTLLHAQAAHLPERLPMVLTAEFTFAIRRDQALASGRAIDKGRAAAGLLRRERVYRVMVRDALSIQCNGPAAMRAYGPLACDPLGFMDHRITESDVRANDTLPPWDGIRPLRLGFSGRWTAIKGPEYAVRAMEVLRDHLPGVTLTMFGGGDLDAHLRGIAGPDVRFAGFCDFETEWKPLVRETVDLMLLPHIQGDPSCTYYESLSSGAPVIGFPQATLSPLVRDNGVGVVARRRDARSLAEAVLAAASDVGQYQRMRRAGLELVGAETWENVNRSRVEHLVRHAEGGRR